MEKTATLSVDEYIASQPPKAQKGLQRIRKTVLKVVPDAEERISYKVPAFRWHGVNLVYYAAWEEHLSLYPGSKKAIEAFKKELANYKLGRGTIQFPLSDPVPVDLVERIVKYRADEILASK